MTKRRRGHVSSLQLASVLAAVLIGAAACGGAAQNGNGNNSNTPSSNGGAKGPMKIGLVGAFSGPYAISTKAVADTFRVWVASVNDSGGINGRKIQVVKRDDEGSPQKSVQIVRKLVEGGVKVMVGPVENAPALGSLEQQLDFTNFVILPDQRLNDPSKFPTTFNNYQTPQAEVGTLLNAAKRKGKTKLAVVAADVGDLADQELPVLKKQVKSSGIHLVYKHVYDPQASDFSAVAAKIKQSGANGIALIAVGPGIARFLQSVSAANLDVPIFASSGATASDLSTAPKAITEHQMTSAVVSSAILHDGKPAKGYQKLTKALYAKYGKKSVQGSGMTLQFDSFEMMKFAIEKAGGPDPKKMRKVLESQVKHKSFLSPVIKYTLSPTDHDAFPSTAKAMTMVHPLTSSQWPGYYTSTKG